MVEKLYYSNLGRKRADRKVFNLIKGFYGLLENELKKYNIKLSYVNPAYTKLFLKCVQFAFILKKIIAKGMRFVAKLSEMWIKAFKPVLSGMFKGNLISEADYVAANNILAREHESLLNLTQKQVKEWIMRKQSSLQLLTNKTC